jgi:hypothetical protein
MTTGKPKPYRIEFSVAEVDAIGFYVGCYELADLLWKHIHELDDHTPARYAVMELTEPQAWELMKVWDEDAGPLSCGSGPLNSKLGQFIGRI